MNIEKYLVLNKYFLELFGEKDNRGLLRYLKSVEEGERDGLTNFAINLMSKEGVKLPKDELKRYDQNIQEYLRRINQSRPERIRLKYFQYLAVLFTEIFIDRLKNRKWEFLAELNDFVNSNSLEKKVRETVGEFSEEDLKKLAFWMATGSGKTLIMHINYLQFLRYKPFEPDNILLITPNEGLSKQHYEEMQKSGIPCRLYSESGSSSGQREHEVLIIEITKLAENTRGRGRSIHISAFEGKNLIFVDEGHKGKRSEEKKWAKLRDKLIEKGFAFEYSATFGQILDKEDILKEYAKAIIFDYSYKHFYLDGYGKDFWVLNIKNSKIDDFTEMAFCANLLDFYQQLLVYEEKRGIAKEHNIEKPLWIFVGSTVSGKNIDSDIVKVLDLIRNSLNKDWLKERIDKILNGEFKNEQGEDIFRHKFERLRSGFDLEDLYKKVFNGRGKLRILEIKRAEGEFGLRLGENAYFGVVNIGDVSAFRKLLKEKGFEIEQDAISDSLFDSIKRENSTINILIGSKKFIEGWDTWRVSCMGLLNIGKGEGPQIIQLFGRGVRLKGKNLSLKRSGNPEISTLETLNIYGISADYIGKFLETIKKEGMEPEKIEIKVPVCVLNREIWKDFPYPTKDESKRFERERVLHLRVDTTISASMNLVPSMAVYMAQEQREDVQSSEVETQIASKSIAELVDIELFDWTRIYTELLEFKKERNYLNLSFDLETLKEILKERCKVIVPNDFEVKDLKGLKNLENIAISLLKSYIDKFYKREKGRFEKDIITYKPAGEQLSLFRLASDIVEYYKLTVPAKEQRLIEKIKELVENIDALLDEQRERGVLPRVVINNSVFVPLLLEKEGIKISPPGLNEGEKRFLEGLRDYLDKNPEILDKYHIVLLRNEAREGVGFMLDWGEFYPDFILWIREKNGNRIYIIFVEPKGLKMLGEVFNYEKVRFLSEGLKETFKKQYENWQVEVKGFILSTTPYEELRRGQVVKDSESKEEYEEKKREYEGKNILFLEDRDWAEKFFERVLPAQHK
ncbi:type III restriction endonuclease subunit R [Thermocrinis ruber]|uniref:Type III restriction endonuclease subunit R n=1 Tax=Thermocrinis ruber TaxID=75906 RepID=W0DB84_9AQUI|nr:DEAD/DEAH box helicase family protein [Thermocrinis ruber]AHE95511.1 type III restriction endonuclease subunit R [Thermocrinis ruber]